MKQGSVATRLRCGGETAVTISGVANKRGMQKAQAAPNSIPRQDISSPSLKGWHLGTRQGPRAPKGLRSTAVIGETDRVIDRSI